MHAPPHRTGSRAGPHGRGLRLTGLAALCLISAYAWTQSNTLIYSGDANVDGTLDAADVHSVETILVDGLPEDPFLQLVADANQDGVIDESDVQFIADVLLGQEEPLPLATYVNAPVVSFDRREDTLPTMVSSAPVSYLREMEVELRHLTGATVSFLRGSEPLFLYISGRWVSFLRELEND